MPWYRVAFDLDRDQPPGIEPQIAVALRVEETYRVLGAPKGFAVYDLNDFESKLYSFFFSSIAAQHFAAFIGSNRGEVWDKPLPDGVNLIIGDTTVLPDAD